MGNGTFSIRVTLEMVIFLRLDLKLTPRERAVQNCAKVPDFRVDRGLVGLIHFTNKNFKLTIIELSVHTINCL